MNEIFDLRQEITSLQLQLQQEKLSKSKTNSCENEEKIVIENLKSQITSYKTENKFLKEERKSKNHYFNDTTHKKDNIREDKACHNKLNHQQKKTVINRKDCFIKRTGKE